MDELAVDYTFISFSIQLYFFIFLFFKIFLMFIFERERETERAWAGGRQRGERHRIRKQAPGSELSTQSPMQGLNSRTVRSWPEAKSDAQSTEPTRCPYFFLFLSLLHCYHQVSPKFCYRIGNLLSAWLNMSGIIIISVFFLETFSVGLSPFSCSNLDFAPSICYRAVIEDSSPQHLGEHLCHSPELDCRSLVYLMVLMEHILLNFLRKCAKGSSHSLLIPNTNIQEIEQRRILISWGRSQQNNLEHRERYRSHSPVSSTNKSQEGKKSTCKKIIYKENRWRRKL